MGLFGLADFFLKKGVNKGIEPNVLMYYSLLIAAVPFGILWFMQPGQMKIDIPLLGYSFTIALFFFMGTLALISALKKGDASIVVPIGRMGFVITAVCAFIFLSETFTITRGLGILFAILAILYTVFW